VGLHYGRPVQICLETERLVLREFTAADVDLLVELDADPEVMCRITGGLPTSREDIERDYIPAYLAYHARGDGYGIWWPWTSSREISSVGSTSGRQPVTRRASQSWAIAWRCRVRHHPSAVVGAPEPSADELTSSSVAGPSSLPVVHSSTDVNRMGRDAHQGEDCALELQYYSERPTLN